MQVFTVADVDADVDVDVTGKRSGGLHVKTGDLWGECQAGGFLVGTWIASRRNIPSGHHPSAITSCFL
jgi:hypothetical protein